MLCATPTREPIDRSFSEAMRSFARFRPRPIAHLSDTSLLGFDQRLARFGERLSEILERQSWDQLDAAESRQRRGPRPRSIDQRGPAGGASGNGRRLVRWLGERKRRGDVDHRSLAEAAVEHLREGGFVDWARLSLRSGDPVRGAFRGIRPAGRGSDEDSGAAGPSVRPASGGLDCGWDLLARTILPVERILEELVAPLAAQAPCWSS